MQVHKQRDVKEIELEEEEKYMHHHQHQYQLLQLPFKRSQRTFDALCMAAGCVYLIHL